MAKTMAVLDDGTVTNIIWCSEAEPETDGLKDPADRPVGIGDTYSEGKFYRDGAEVLTPLEAALAEIAALRQQIGDLDEAYREGVNSL